MSKCTKKWPTFSLVPLAPVESALSLPAKSTRLILLTCIQKEMLCLRTVMRSNAHISKISLCQAASIHQKWVQSPILYLSDAHFPNNSMHHTYEINLYLFRGVLWLAVMPLLCEDDVENCMRTAACLVHVGGCHSPEDRRMMSKTQKYRDII